LIAAKDILERAIGSTTVRLERLHYEFGGRLEERGDDLQVHLGDGVIRFGAGPDGERIEIADTPWQDPFAPPLSPENAEFVRTHGALRLVDVSSLPGYRDWVGKRVAKATLLYSDRDVPMGVLLEADDGLAMKIVVDCDELDVHFGAQPS
jgi:hypothetical protein